MRAGRLTGGAIAARLAPLPGMAIAGIFIGVSGLACVTFGYRLGEPSGNGLIFAALALGIEGFADLAVPLFWRRLRLIGRGLLLAFFALCLAYKLTAANRFAAENLGKRETAVATAATDYGLARDRVEHLRQTVAATIDARPAAILQSEIDGLLRDPRTDGCSAKINGDITARVCPRVDALRTELARALARDQAQAALPAAIGALRGMAPVAAPAAADDAGAIAALLGLLGFRIASWSAFVAHLIMAIVEGGAIVVPMLVGFAYGGERKPPGMGGPMEASAPRKPPAAGEEPLEAKPPQASTRRITERGERDLTDLTAFLGAETERAAGEQVQSTALYFHYCSWKQDRSEKPISLIQFGSVLTQHLGLAKVKAGGKIHYLNLRLKASQTPAKASGNLQVVGTARRASGRLKAPANRDGEGNEKAA